MEGLDAGGTGEYRPRRARQPAGKVSAKAARIGKAPKRKADDYIPAGVFHSGDFREDLHKARTGQGEGNGFGICRKDSAICGSSSLYDFIRKTSINGGLQKNRILYIIIQTD